MYLIYVFLVGPDLEVLRGVKSMGNGKLRTRHMWCGPMLIIQVSREIEATFQQVVSNLPPAQRAPRASGSAWRRQCPSGAAPGS